MLMEKFHGELIPKVEHIFEQAQCIFNPFTHNQIPHNLMFINNHNI